MGSLQTCSIILICIDMSVRCTYTKLVTNIKDLLSQLKLSYNYNL